MSPIAQRRTNYQRLRSEYDLAFHNLASEVENLMQPKVHDGINRGSVLQIEEQVSAAHQCYLRRRNDLADYLLSRRAETRIMRLAPETISDQRELLSVAE